MQYDIEIPGYLRRLAGLHFPGSTTVGHAVSRLRACNATVRLELENGTAQFVFPVRTKANYRLIRGEFRGSWYDLSVPYEPGLTRYLGRTLSPGYTFIDIGANVGWFSLIAANLVGPEGRCYAFEPSPSNYSRLCDNLYRFNRLTNCFAVPVALSNRDDMISLSHPRFDDGTGNYMAPGQHGDIRCARADQVLGQLPDRPAHVKVDVEAAEYLAIDGFGALIDRVDSFMVEVSGESSARFGVSPADLFALMESRAFEAHRLLDDGTLQRLREPVTGDVVFTRQAAA